MEDKNLNLKKIIKSLSDKNVRDYLYISVFFILFSIFIFFAIKPALTTAFSLVKEESELKEKNLTYQRAIADANKNLYILEEFRDKLYLIDESISNSPQINKIVDDIGNANNTNLLSLKNIFVSEKIDYIDPKKNNFKEVRVNLETQGDFAKVVNMIRDINLQRRLKLINKIDFFNQIEISTNSGLLDIKAEIIGYYL